MKFDSQWEPPMRSNSLASFMVFSPTSVVNLPGFPASWATAQATSTSLTPSTTKTEIIWVFVHSSSFWLHSFSRWDHLFPFHLFICLFFYFSIASMHFAPPLLTSILSFWGAFPYSPCFKFSLSQPDFLSFLAFVPMSPHYCRLKAPLLSLTVPLSLTVVRLSLPSKALSLSSYK